MEEEQPVKANMIFHKFYLYLIGVMNRIDWRSNRLQSTA